MVAKDVYVSFLPSHGQISEIEKWLVEERNLAGEGFYCNWLDIIDSYKKGQVVIITYKESVIGFATWWISCELVGRFSIVEIHPKYRGKGYGRMLTQSVSDFFVSKNILVAVLQCNPPSSEHIWKRFGFVEHLTRSQPGDKILKSLYKILTPHVEPNTDLIGDDTIELWCKDEYKVRDNIPPDFTWNISFKDGTNELTVPIIHPAYTDWKLRWKKNGVTINEGRIKEFKEVALCDNFFVITKLLS